VKTKEKTKGKRREKTREKKTSGEHIHGSLFQVGERNDNAMKTEKMSGATRFRR
jgi:hypothetical protein